MTLYEELKKFSQKDSIRFHIPGHHGGRGLNPKWMKDAFSLDVTEFSETDDLQRPQGVLRDAQARAAAIFGAGRSFYLTHGSSLGLQAAILGSCRPGEKILIDRTCHKSVMAGVVLAGADPIFLEPDFDRERGIYIGISAEAVAQALEQDPDIVGAVITSPTYYGICSEIEGIAAHLHARGKFLVVDEAHGAHFAFHPDLPEPALNQGADLVVQSIHKTLPALGQSSLLHLHRESRILAAGVERALRLLQTTSPSYLLMTAMDEAIVGMERDGKAILSRLRSKLEAVKKAVRAQGILDFADQETLGKKQDGTRLVVDFRRANLCGLDAAQQLKERYGIYPEMADPHHVVLVVTVANTAKDLETLQQALLELAVWENPSHLKMPMEALPKPRMAMSPREAWSAPRKTLPLKKAMGYISADMVSVCPPGAAILVPGQYLDGETLAYLQEADITKEVDVVLTESERG